MNNKDIAILRNLASKYFEIANSDKNRENILLHKKVNDLEQPRPIVLIDEIPWHEMNFDDELALKCEDDFCRNIEYFLKRTIYQWKHMPADMVVKPYFEVHKVIYSTGIGLNRIEKEHQNDAKSFTFVDQLKSEYKDAVKKELTRIVNACKRNGCSCDIVLKDITTVCNRPQNLFEWEKIAMDIVKNY